MFTVTPNQVARELLALSQLDWNQTQFDVLHVSDGSLYQALRNL